MSSSLALKIVTCPLTFVLMAVGCLLPWWLTRLKSAIGIMGLASCFAGGVILGAAFSHLLPDSREAWQTYFTLIEADEMTSNYPFEAAMSMITFLVLVIADTLANHAQSHMVHGHAQVGNYHNHFVGASNHPIEDNPQNGNQNNGIAKQMEQIASPVPTSELSPTDDAQVLEKLRGGKGKVIQAYVFFIALSLHSIFDGMSLGAEEAASNFYPIFIAILLHKTLDGFALGLPLYFAKLPKIHIGVAVVVSSAMTPLGVALGIILTESLEGTVAYFMRAMILSLSTGSFIFISLIEMIPGGLSHPKFITGKVLLLVFGWGIMALLAAWS